MAFKRCRKVYYVDTVLKENKKDSTHKSCVATEKKFSKNVGHAFDQTNRLALSGRARAVFFLIAAGLD
jgi:hypothetical protein